MFLTPALTFANKSINYQGESLSVYPLTFSVCLSKISAPNASVAFFSPYTEIDEFEGGSLSCFNSALIKNIKAADTVSITGFFTGESIKGNLVDIAPASVVHVKNIQAVLLKLGCFLQTPDVKVKANRLALFTIGTFPDPSGVRIDKDKSGHDRALLPCSGKRGIVSTSCPSIILNEIFGYGTLRYLEDSRPHSFLELKY